MAKPSPVVPLPRSPAGHYHFSGVLHSEWTKLWSVRSTPLTLLGVAVVTIGIAIAGTTTIHWNTRVRALRTCGDSPSSRIALATLILG